MNAEEVNMATRKRKKATRPVNPWSYAALPPLANGGALNGSLEEFYGDLMRMGQQYTDFCTMRSRAYMELPRVLTECQTPEDYYEAEMEFWTAAYHQYKDFASHTLPGPLTVLGGLIEGQVPRQPARSAAKPAAKRKTATKRKSTRTTSTRRRTTPNGSALYSYPEHVEGRTEVRGRIH